MQYLSTPPADENSNPKGGKKQDKKDLGPAFKPASVFGRKLEPVQYLANPVPQHKVPVQLPTSCSSCALAYLD